MSRGNRRMRGRSSRLAARTEGYSTQREDLRNGKGWKPWRASAESPM